MTHQLPTLAALIIEDRSEFCGDEHSVIFKRNF